jgi:hypothetical protein
MLNDKTRIDKDILMFQENLEKIKNIDLDEKYKFIIELSKQYFEDSKYYLKKKDFFTAFGCINYAHGLLDAIIKSY